MKLHKWVRQLWVANGAFSVIILVLAILLLGNTPLRGNTVLFAVSYVVVGLGLAVTTATLVASLQFFKKLRSEDRK